MSEIKDILIEFIEIWNKQNEIYSKLCTVDSVDSGKRICTCSPTDGSSQLLEVRLESDITINSDSEPISSTSKGFFVVPEVGSLVVVTFISKTEAFVSAWTEISDIVVKTTNYTTEQDLFKFNDGAFGGLIKISDLETKLNNLVTEINALKDLYNNHIHITTATVGASPTPGVISPTTSTGSNMTNFNKNDFENTDIIHG